MFEKLRKMPSQKRANKIKTSEIEVKWWINVKSRALWMMFYWLPLCIIIQPISARSNNIMAKRFVQLIHFSSAKNNKHCVHEQKTHNALLEASKSILFSLMSATQEFNWKWLFCWWLLSSSPPTSSSSPQLH